MWIVAALFLTLVVVSVALLPLLSPVSVVGGIKQASNADTMLADSKERGLRALKDLDLDYAMGKLSKDDYDQLRQSLTSEVATILAELKGHGQR